MAACRSPVRGPGLGLEFTVPVAGRGERGRATFPRSSRKRRPARLLTAASRALGRGASLPAPRIRILPSPYARSGWILPGPGGNDDFLTVGERGESPPRTTSSLPSKSSHFP